VSARWAASRSILLLVIALAVLPLIAACGAEKATLYGTVPAAYLPVPRGEVMLDVVPAADRSAEPLTSFTSSSTWFSAEVPPGTYVVRILWTRGVATTSRPVEVAAGKTAEVVFDAP
jgi:hypothetical protein